MKWRLKSEEIIDIVEPEGIIERLLDVRGVSDIDFFLNPSVEGLYDPFSLDGVKEGCERILNAIESNRRISIFGDFDVDGVVSTSLLLTVLRKLNADIDFYIPHRLEDGYGLNKLGII